VHQNASLETPLTERPGGSYHLDWQTHGQLEPLNNDSILFSVQEMASGVGELGEVNCKETYRRPGLHPEPSWGTYNVLAGGEPRTSALQASLLHHPPVRPSAVIDL